MVKKTILILLKIKMNLEEIFPLDPFTNPPRHPNIYYRFEAGQLWNIIPNQYFYPVAPIDVFNTFCFSIGGSSTNPVRLVFNDINNYGIWLQNSPLVKGDSYTIFEILANMELPLAEDYIQNVTWFNEDDVIEGCPYMVMREQGALGKEFVLQPSNIVDVAAFHAIVV